MTESDRSKKNKVAAFKDIHKKWLCVQYPECFQTVRPLQKYIYQALVPHMPDGMTKTQLRRFFDWYCQRYEYFQSFGKYDHRINLDGTEGEPVTIEDRVYAQRRLNYQVEKRKQKEDEVAAAKRKAKRERQNAFYRKLAKEKAKKARADRQHAKKESAPKSQ